MCLILRVIQVAIGRTVILYKRTGLLKNTNVDGRINFRFQEKFKKSVQLNNNLNLILHFILVTCLFLHCH